MNNTNQTKVNFI